MNKTENDGFSVEARRASLCLVLVAFLVFPLRSGAFEELSSQELRQVTGKDGLTFSGSSLDLDMDALTFHDASGANGSNNDGYLIFDDITLDDTNYEFTLDADSYQGLVFGINDFDYVDLTVKNVCLDFMSWAECYRHPAFELRVDSFELNGTELQVSGSDGHLMEIDGEFKFEASSIELDDRDGYKSRSGGAWIFDGVSWDDGNGNPVAFDSPLTISASSYRGIRIEAPDMSSFSNVLKVDMMRSSATSTCYSDCPSWEFHGMDPDGSWVAVEGID